MSRGRFITFEGVEGSGKTTQIALLAERLRSAGFDPVVTREPGGTPTGVRLRALLLEEGGAPISPIVELLLYTADRAQHLTAIVEPALARGAVVLCDRYLDATLAYQGHGRGLPLRFILDLHRHPPLDRRPDRTLLLDQDPAQALARARRRNRDDEGSRSEGRMEREDLAFHRRVRDGYLALAAAEPDRFRVIPASGTPEEIEACVQNALSDLLPDELGSPRD